MITDAYTLPVDVDVLAVQPHAHYRAREIKGIATLPDGSTRWMMHITDWDFRWQHVYREVAPIALPRWLRAQVSIGRPVAIGAAVLTVAVFVNRPMPGQAG